MKKLILILLMFICSMALAVENSEKGYIGLLLYKEPFNNKTIIINSFPTSPGAVIPIGSEITRIDDKRIYFLSLDKIRGKLSGDVGTDVKITAKDTNGDTKEYVLTRVPYSELKYDEKFDYYWGMIAPEKYLHTPNLDNLNAVKSKLCIFDNSISNEDYYWAEKRSKFIREYNYCTKLNTSEQKECLNWIVEHNNKTNSDNVATEQNNNSNTSNSESTDNSGWLAGLYILQSMSNTMNTINNNAIQRTQFYNDLSNQKNIYRMNNTLQQQNIQLQKINNTLQRTPNSVIRGDTRYYY